jgi:protein required for attachment to host cells
MKNEKSLEKHIRQLIEIAPSADGVLSCFIRLEHPRAGFEKELEAQFHKLRATMESDERLRFGIAFEQLLAYLEERQLPKTRGVSVHMRLGEDPFFLPMEFEVPLETQLIIDDLPHIYPLIALKDVYHRFVTVITNEVEARIFETTLGAVSEEVLTERKDLRQRIGREWTREHYQNHKHEREQQMIREKIGVIDELMRRGGHNHLVIAGSPTMVGRMTAALPQRLKDKLISTLATNPNSGVNPILLEAVQAFVDAENAESHDEVRKLRRGIHTGGLGVSGFAESLAALEGGYADMLLIDADHLDPSQRETLTRLAAGGGVGVETVSGSEVLQQLGGVGCLLRYRPGGVLAEPPKEDLPSGSLAEASH